MGMNKTDEQLAEILSKSLEVAEKTGSFIIEQAPDLIQQLLLWKTIQHSITTLVGLVIMFFIVKGIVTMFRKAKEEDDYFSDVFLDNPFVPIVFGIGLMIGCFCLSDIYNLLQVVFAPKIYLIEYTASLLK